MLQLASIVRDLRAYIAKCVFFMFNQSINRRRKLATLSSEITQHPQLDHKLFISQTIYF